MHLYLGTRPTVVLFVHAVYELYYTKSTITRGCNLCNLSFQPGLWGQRTIHNVIFAAITPPNVSDGKTNNDAICGPVLGLFEYHGGRTARNVFSTPGDCARTRGTLLSCGFAVVVFGFAVWYTSKTKSTASERYFHPSKLRQQATTVNTCTPRLGTKIT